MSKWKNICVDNVAFCDQCHSILELPDKNNILNCTFCDFRISLNKSKSMLINNHLNKKISSKKDKKRQKDNIFKEKLLDQTKKKNRNMIDKICDKCGETKMAYQARQMRSVDEGQSIIYECLKCGYVTILHS